MTPKLLRFAYVCEFLLALIAIFTVWPEIGGASRAGTDALGLEIRLWLSVGGRHRGLYATS